MPRKLRRHPPFAGAAKLMFDAVRYIAIMTIVVLPVWLT
jgi:hypothetical protein